MSKPRVRRVIEAGPSRQSRETSRKRVSSPNTANNGAEASSPAPFGLRRLRKVLLEELHDHSPALLVRGESLRAARERDLIEAGF